MNTYTIRELRERSKAVVRDAEAGKLSVVTQLGKPLFVAVPFEYLTESNVKVALAISLFREGKISAK